LTAPAAYCMQASTSSRTSWEWSGSTSAPSAGLRATTRPDHPDPDLHPQPPHQSTQGTPPILVVNHDTVSCPADATTGSEPPGPGRCPSAAAAGSGGLALNSVLPVLPGSAWWVTLLASSTDADLRGEPWLSEPTLSRPRVRRPLPPVWGMTMAILFVIAGEVVSLSSAAAASCCPQQILPLIRSSSTRSSPLIDFGDPTNSGGTPCDPSALAASHQLSQRLERLMQPRSLPPIPHRSRLPASVGRSGLRWPGFADPNGSPLSRRPNIRAPWTRNHRSMFHCPANQCAWWAGPDPGSPGWHSLVHRWC